MGFLAGETVVRSRRGPGSQLGVLLPSRHGSTKSQTTITTPTLAVEPHPLFTVAAAWSEPQPRDPVANLMGRLSRTTPSKPLGVGSRNERSSHRHVSARWRHNATRCWRQPRSHPYFPPSAIGVTTSRADKPGRSPHDRSRVSCLQDSLRSCRCVR